MSRSLLVFLLLLAGCATAPTGGPESTREVVLKYLNADVGTTGPFGKNQKKELDVLSAADRATAAALVDQGAVGFVIYGGAASTNDGDAVRIVLVQKDKVVGDYWAAKK